MSTTDPTPSIVVGYDGSPSSRAALRRAVDRAAGGGKVYVVHGYHAPAEFWGYEEYDRALDAALTRGDAVLNDALTAVPQLADVSHETELVAGHPAEVIASVAEIRHADEIIVGTRGFGRLRGALGSVAHALLREAKCPVTVIPEAALEPAADGERVKTGATS